MSAVQTVSGAAHRLGSLIGLRAADGAEPSAGLFRAIRWRLAVWYSGALAVVLLLAGLVLYVGVRQSVLAPVDQALKQQAAVLGQRWLADQGLPGTIGEPAEAAGACAEDRFAPPDWLYVCYDRSGNVIGQSRILAEAAPAVATPSLVSDALHSGQAEDTLTAGGALGTVRRYAVRVPSADGHGPLGVLQAVTPIGPQLETLDTLLRLLLMLGVATVVLAAGAGLFLANRALLPARVAYARQRDFVADASHELRTPLTMLRSNVEVVLRGKDRLPPEDVELLEDTVSEAAHLSSVANSMLDLARLDGDANRIERDVVDLSRLADDMARWAVALAAEHQVAIRAEHAEPVLVVGDRTLLEQALLVLVENGIKYNRPGGVVTVASRLVGEEARLEVRDTGIGIEASHLSRLGERFYRVDKARSRALGGAGLGLALVRSIAARHGGSFRVESEPGIGTAAILALPAARKT